MKGTFGVAGGGSPSNLDPDAEHHRPPLFTSKTETAVSTKVARCYQEYQAAPAAAEGQIRTARGKLQDFRRGSRSLEWVEPSGSRLCSLNGWLCVANNYVQNYDE